LYYKQLLAKNTNGCNDYQNNINSFSFTFISIAIAQPQPQPQMMVKKRFSE